MKRHAPKEPDPDPRLLKVLRDISQDVFGPDEDIKNLDFATIEKRSREVAQRVARHLAEEAAAKQAQDRHGPQPCPDCGRPSSGTIETRELLIQDGPIQLQESVYHCSQCRRDFFPQ